MEVSPATALARIHDWEGADTAAIEIMLKHQLGDFAALQRLAWNKLVNLQVRFGDLVRVHQELASRQPTPLPPERQRELYAAEMTASVLSRVLSDILMKRLQPGR